MKPIRNAPSGELTFQFRNADVKVKLYVFHMSNALKLFTCIIVKRVTYR